MIEQLIQAYSGNTRLLLLSGVTFACGYIQYIYSFRLVLRENKAPFPVWMHTLYLAHDATAAIVFFALAREHQWFWFFSLTAIALFIWTLFEVFNLYMAIKVERQDIWGAYQVQAITSGQALCRILLQLMIMIVVVNLLRIFMADEAMFKWFALSNVVMAVGPGMLWRQRQSREGSSLGLALVIVFGTAWTFLPPGLGMFTTALPGIFDQGWFYLTGVAVTLVALNNLIMLIRFAPKTHKGGKPVIW
jgi:hypothetical protein